MNDDLVSCAHFRELDSEILYDLLRLRSDVFVMEQKILYLDLDDRDKEPETLHVWINSGGGVASTLRVLRDPDGARRIGRVCTARDRRGAGLAERMIRSVCSRYQEQIVMLAQTYLLSWYESLGLTRDGEDHILDGILHTPMRLER